MTLCECGAPADAVRQCRRCEYLDGPAGVEKTAIVAGIIAAIRVGGPMTLRELTEEVDTHAETVQRALYRLLENGRVGRYAEEFTCPPAQVHVVAKKRAAYTRAQRDANTRMRYFLRSESCPF